MQATRDKPTQPRGEGVRDRRVRRRRADILDAALEAFVARGFDATRMDDVAVGAGVAKGTLYLHFADKAALFEAVVRSVMEPPPDVARMVEPAARDAFEAEVLPNMVVPKPSRKADVIRLVIAEGMRHPAIAEFYYREVLAPALEAERARLSAMVEAGTLRYPELAKYPQLLVAPALLGVIWDGLFSRFEPLDLEAMLKVHAAYLRGD